MHQTQWLREAETAMLRAGLPKKYVNRTCSELNDHLEESRSEGTTVVLSTESPLAFAKAIAKSYRSRGLIRRVPPVLLLLMPLPLTVLITLVYFLACYVILDILFDCFDGANILPLHVTMTMWTLFYSGKLAGPLLSGWAAFEIAKRMARPWYWAALLIIAQCLAIAATRAELEIAKNDSSVIIELGSGHIFIATQLVSAAAIALLGIYLVSRQRQEQLRSLAHAKAY